MGDNVEYDFTKVWEEDQEVDEFRNAIREANGLEPIYPKMYVSMDVTPNKGDVLFVQYDHVNDSYKMCTKYTSVA